MTSILIEGIDGTGKTSLAIALSAKLNYTYLKHPSAWYYDNETTSAYSNAHLHVADFYQHSDFIATNNVVIDRYLPSHMAYEILTPNAANAVDWHRVAQNVAIPDIVFYLDCSVQESCKRLETRIKKDWQETTMQLNIVRRNYLENVIPLLKMKGWKIYTIDAHQPIDVIVNKCIEFLYRHNESLQLPELPKGKSYYVARV